MKTTYKTLYSVALLVSLLMVSCREEESEFIQAPPDQSLESNSAIAGLLQNTSMKDGSNDNIIDSASCITIALPVTVTVNGLEIIVDSNEDLEVIEDIFDEFDNDNDHLEIEFPITIILSDFTEIWVNNLAEFKDFTDDCNQDNVEDDDIECVDIEYPITASIFDLSNELINTLTISNDRDLYNFIDDLSEDIVVNVTFPITVFLLDSTRLEVFDLEELAEIIGNAKDSCDEDDDTDFDDDDCNNCTTGQLSEILLDCPGWKVDKLERDDQDLEELYEAYSFGFKSDGDLTVFNGNDSISGEWESSGDGNNITVIINVPGLNDFNDSWTLHEIETNDDDQHVDLRLGEDRLRFESECFSDGDDNNNNDVNTESLDSLLTNGDWIVASYLDDGENETSDYNGYEITFNENGTVVASNGSTIEGTWSIQSSEGKLVLDFGTSVPFDEFNDDWEVVSFTANRIELRDVSGGGGGTDTLVFEKL